jgi:hypothetical protein
MGETESEGTETTPGGEPLEGAPSEGAQSPAPGEETTGDAASRGVEGDATQEVGDDVQQEVEDR